MEERTIMLKSYRKEIEVLSIEIDVPTYDDERRNYFYKYEDVLLKLFNSKREDSDILKIENYYNSNAIKVYINLTSYVDHNKTKEECIEHLKTWFTSNLDIRNEDVKTEITKGYIYEIPEWENKIETYKEENGNYEIIHNFIEWGD